MSTSGRNSMDENDNELELLRIENKDLTEKLETLKQKRKEDHPKLIEYDKNVAELKALREFKTRLVESNTKLQRSLQEKEKELSELVKTSQEKYDWLSEVEERLELITVEKEMAEEKAELLQAEVETEKQRVQELEIELELLRSESEQTGDGVLQGDGLQLKQLEYQNEKLREAVVRLRDVVGQLAEDKREFVEENEKLKDESAALVKICENLRKDLQTAEQTMAALKEQLLDVNERVEATVDSEKIIEALTQKNMDLEKKLSTLEETVEDYETIRAMDEEILETQREAERDLKEEFDLANGRISDLTLQIRSYSEQVGDYERTVMKFRRKISELNEEIQEKHDEIISLQEQLKGGQEGSSDAMSLQSTRLTTATRTFAEIVDAEVCALELKYEIQFSNYLKAFLPDNFSKAGGDGDAILLNVRCARVSDKSALLSKLLNLKYPPAPGGMRREHVTKSHKAEQWAHCAKFAFLLSSFGRAVRKSESALQNCSAERLSRLAQLQSDIAKEERMIDQYIGLLKSDKFDENTPADGIEKGTNFFENLLSVHLSGELFDSNQMFLDVSAQLLYGLFWMKISAQRISFFVPDNYQPLVDDSKTSRFGKLVPAWIEKCEQLCMRLKNRIPSGKNIVVTQEMETKLVNLYTVFRKVVSILDNVCSIASIQLSTLAEAEGLEETHIQEALLYSVEKAHGTLNGTGAEEVISEYLTSIENIIVDLVDKLDNEELQSTTVEKPVSPLIERANARKQDAVEAEKLRWHLEKKENEMTELKMNLRGKLDDISNYKLRLEMAEKKIESMGKIDESEVQKLYSYNDELRDQLKKAKMEYEETLETLQSELENCEKENAELRKRAKAISKKVLMSQLQSINTAMIHSKSQPLFSPTTPTDPSMPNTEQLNEVEYLEAELKETKRALEWAHRYIRQLKANERMHMLSAMEAVTISSDICGPLTLLSVQGSEKEELDALCRRAEGILSDARIYQVPYVVDTSQSKSKQEFEKQKHRQHVAHLNQRIADLKIDIHRFWNKHRRGGQMPSLFSNIESITSSRLKKKEEDTTESQSKGVHSAAYKNAFESLFGNLDEERKKMESAQIPVCA